MLRSMYSGVAGLRAHQIRMDVVANNIANVNTSGFKAGRANFQDVLAQSIGRTAINTTQVGLGVGLAAIDNIHTQGALQTTGRTLDLAIEGNGFFEVKDGSGNIYYTRDGTFYIDKDGYLVNAQGYKVQDKNGADIQFTNPGAIVSISVATNGDITATYSGAAPVTKTIGLATFDNVESLQRAGSNLWKITSGLTASGGSTTEPFTLKTPGTGGAGIIRSGYLEMSNVDLAQEFTTMITTQRGYQANARSITTSDELLQELVNLKR